MNVTLRDVVEADLPVLFEHQWDEEAARMAAFPSRDREAFTVHWTTKILGNPAVTAKAILVEGSVAGNVVAFERSGRRLIGYWVGREYWGRGVATRALAAFVAEVPWRPLYAHVVKNNVASIRVLEKCGFTFVETSSSQGDGLDELVMALETLTARPARLD